MALTPAEITKKIKEANDIVDVIATYLPVHPAGKQFKAVCPFHEDHRPSLTIDRQWQNYKCWACGAAGDLFAFVEKFEKVSFKEARAILARRAGIRLDADSPADQRRSQLFETMAWAQKKFHDCYFESPEAEQARKYVGERKLAGSIVRQFGLGFAPIDGEWLVKAAQKDEIRTEFLVELGLIAARDENRGFYDRFRDRVMFPIRDLQGRVVAFGGRILPNSPTVSRAPKYYNSPDTPLFNKSEIVYGLDLARNSAGKDGYVAVVEGYTDVLMAHHHGVTSVVATMGTALTASHVAQLRRYAPKVVLVYDADAGGMSGVDRALELFVSQDVELAVASLPQGKDPADLLTEPGGIEIFRDCLASARDALDFKLESLLAKGDAGIDGTRRMIDAVLAVMALAPPVPHQGGQMKQELMLNRLAHRLGVSQASIWSRFRELQRDRRRAEARDAYRSPSSAPTPMAATSAPDPLARQLLQVLLAEPALVSLARLNIPAADIQHPDARRLIDELYALNATGEPADLDALRLQLMDDRPDLVQVAMRLETVGRTLTDRAVWLDKVVGEFAARRRDAGTKALKAELTSAGDDDAARSLLRRQIDATKKSA